MDYLECGVCKDSFSSILPFILHKAAHTGGHDSSKHICELCGQLFYSTMPLTGHYSHIHQMACTPEDTPQSQDRNSRSYPLNHGTENANGRFVYANRTDRTLNGNHKTNDICSNPRPVKQGLISLLDNKPGGQLDSKIEANTSLNCRKTNKGSDRNNPLNNINADEMLVSVKNQPMKNILLNCRYGNAIECTVAEQAITVNDKNVRVITESKSLKQKHRSSELANEMNKGKDGDIPVVTTITDTAQDENSFDDKLMVSDSAVFVVNEMNKYSTDSNHFIIDKCHVREKYENPRNTNSQDKADESVNIGTLNMPCVGTCSNRASLAAESRAPLRNLVSIVKPLVYNTTSEQHSLTDRALNTHSGLHELNSENLESATPTRNQLNKTVCLNKNGNVDDSVMCQIKEKVFVFKSNESECLPSSSSLTDSNFIHGSSLRNNGKMLTNNSLASTEGATEGCETSVVTQSNTLPKPLRTIPTELNMPDFYFIFSQKSSDDQNDKTISEAFVSNGKNEFKCLLCGEAFNWQRTLCSHMRAKHITELKSEKGMSPNKNFTSDGAVLLMSSYIEMVETLRQKPTRAVERQDLPGTFPCDECDKVFHRLRNLRRHKVCHSKGGNQFLCTLCAKSFKTAALLKQHMSAHGKKMFKCAECDFMSDVNIAIHDHRQIHPNKSIVCEICGSAYNDRSTLKKHMRVHDPARPFACKYPGCTLRFLTKAMCNGHFQGHTEPPKFECQICGHKFKRKQHLNRHEKVVHKIATEHRNATTKHYARQVKSYDMESSHASDYITSGDFANDTQEGLVIDDEEASMDSEEQYEDMNVVVDIDNSLQTSNLTNAADECSVSTLNYAISDMGNGIVYQTLLHDEAGNQLDTHSILMVEGQQILYEQGDIGHDGVQINPVEEIHP